MPCRMITVRHLRFLILLRGAFLSAVLSASALSTSPASSQGIVIDQVASGTEVEKAGLQVGDVLVSWERAATPPANPEAACGELASPFDWMWLEVEQVHRGPMVLYGRRNGQPRSWNVASGEWNVHFNADRRERSRARPELHPEVDSEYLRGQELVGKGETEQGIGVLRTLADKVSAEAGDTFKCWLLLRIGELWGGVGRWEQAHEAFVEAMSWSREERTRVFLWEAVGKSLEYQARFQEAEEAYRQALRIRERQEPGGLGVGRSVHQIASQELNLGNWEGARRGFDRALKIRSAGAPGSFLEADSLHSQGLLAAERSDLDSAEHYLKRAVAIQERLGTDSFWMAFKLETLGNVFAFRGDLEVATEYLEQALALRERFVPDGESVALSLVRLGRIKLDQGRWREARVRFEQALAILTRVFPRHPALAVLFNGLGDASFAEGDSQGAEVSYRRALAQLALVSPGRPWAAQSWNGLGDVEARRRNWQEALADYRKALEIQRRAGGGTDGEARILAGLGRVHRRMGDREEASRRFHEAIGVLEAQVGRLGGSEDVKSEYRSLRRKVYFEAAAVDLELGRAEEAWNVQEAGRAQGFLSLLGARDLRFFDGVPAEIEVERRRLGREFRQALATINSISTPQDKDSVAEAWKKLPLLRERRDFLAEQVRALAPRSTGIQFPQPLRVPEIARELDPGMKIVAYQVGDSETLAFVLSADGGIVASKLPIGADDLERDIERFRALVERGAVGGWEGALSPLRRLYHSVVKPVEPLLDGADRLLILPDGPLHGIPWAALVRERGGTGKAKGRNEEFLVEWKPFSVALSATVWVELKHSRRAAPAALSGSNEPESKVVAFGDPAFSRPSDSQAHPTAFHLAASLRRGLSLEPLPDSRREVEAISKLFPGTVTAYLGEEATEERAKHLPLGSRIVHFATHSFADERLPLNSGLVFTPPKPGDLGGEDGFLQAWEIFEEVRIDADLVVLSSCDSGIGRDLGGEGLLSLTRAFQFAGARSVMASLWQVVDRGAADLMMGFYRYLRDGSSTADALRQAQLEIIGRKSSAPDPAGNRKFNGGEFSWAAFQVFGDWR